MKRIYLLLCLCAATRLVTAQTVWTDKSRVMPDKLRTLPVGLMIVHTPNPVFPVKEGSTYYWKHQTTAVAMNETLTVVSCGSFIWYNERGWQANISYSNEDFARNFNCPGGVLKKGHSYTFIKNWRYGEQLYAGDALWYIIARDRNGKLYKGYGLIETEATVLNPNDSK